MKTETVPNAMLHFIGSKNLTDEFTAHNITRKAKSIMKPKLLDKILYDIQAPKRVLEIVSEAMGGYDSYLILERRGCK